MNPSKINSSTTLYGVIGDPIKHSLSPVMHNAAFEAIGYNGVYLAFGVKNVEDTLKGMRALNIKGLSVTIPHKLTVMDYLDEIDEQAKNIGAVNTVINKDGYLYGYNSDCLGATNALLEKTEIKGKDVLLVGAGGAARAIGFGIKKEGGNLTILNIIKEEGEALAKDLGVNYYPLEDYHKFDCDILINATPIGMTPNTDETSVPVDFLKKEMVVMDIVYNPLKTKLLKESENIGCTTVDGVSMFVYQGVSQFESFTGEKAPVELMRNVVLDALSR